MSIPRLGMMAAAGAFAAMITIGIGGGDPATSGHPLGTRQTLPAAGGTIAAYTVTGLSPSTDAVPARGRLYQATLTVEAERGTVTPMIGLFNARAAGGQIYPVLERTTAQGLSRDVVPQGSWSSGRIYFDVVGEAPDSVVCNNGMADLMVWDGASPGTTAPPPPLDRGIPRMVTPDTMTVSI